MNPGIADKLWARRLHRCRMAQPHLRLVFPDRILPAAALWAGVDAWTDALRAAGVQDGDRVVLAADAGPAFVPVLLAALRLRLTLAVVAKPASGQQDLLAGFDARLLVTAAADVPHACSADAAGVPLAPLAARRPSGPPTPDARLLLRTSATSSGGRWIALSDRNLLAVLDSHAALQALQDGCLLSILPWHHVFGLVLDLLAALLAGAVIVRAEAVARDPAGLLATAQHHPVTHLNAVPITLERLLQQAGGEPFLRGLRGGVVGGAPISAALAARLVHTRLRVGYGQTEAAPGICLGAEGEFMAGWLGRPVGCAVRIAAGGTLAFQGPNAALGEWTAAGLTTHAAGRWVDTGDLVRAHGDGYVFEGRLSDCFKMANGRFLSAAVLERAILAACPGIALCMVGTVDGVQLEIALGSADAAAIPQQALAAQLLEFGVHQFRLHRVAPEHWRLGSKGEPDRRHPPWMRGRTDLDLAQREGS